MGTIRERGDSMAGNTSQPSIKRVWGIAKSPELKLTDEELHLLVQAHTGKDSIKALNKRELQTVIRVLVVGAIREVAGKKNKYTIVEEKNGWGRLKSGAGWISLSYTKKAS